MVAFVGVLGCTRRTFQVTNSVRPSAQAETLYVEHSQKPAGMDPALQSDSISIDELGRTYEGLLQYHYLKRPYTLIPNLAEAPPEISADGLTYTFKIKKGVLFQDDPSFKDSNGRGRELTADDIVYSLMRVADPQLGSYAWYWLDGKVVGLNSWREQSEKSGSADYSAKIEGLKSLNRYTVQLKLNQPYPRLIYFFAAPASFVVAQEAVNYYGTSFFQHPVGTGPFQLLEASNLPRLGELIWIKNPSFRQETYPKEGESSDKAEGLLRDAGKTLPLVNRIVVNIYVDETQRWQALVGGKLDMSPVPTEDYQKIVAPNKDLGREFKAQGLRLEKHQSLEVTHISFNMENPVLKDNRFLRQALSLAVDQQTFNQAFYNDRATTAQGPVPPGILGYEADFKNPYRLFSPGKAKEFLIKAGYTADKERPELEYLTVADTKGKQTAEFLSRAFASVGINLKVTDLSADHLLESIRAGKSQLWSLAWQVDYPDPENLYQAFYSKQIVSGLNDSRYSNPAFDQLFETSLHVSDTKTRQSLYRRMQEIVVEDCPWIFGARRQVDQVLQPWLKNFKFHDFDPGRSKYYGIDSQLKKKEPVKK